MSFYSILEAVKSVIFPTSKAGVIFFRNYFFASSIIEWNKLDGDIHNSDSLNFFKLSISKLVRPVANSIFDINNP